MLSSVVYIAMLYLNESNDNRKVKETESRGANEINLAKSDGPSVED